ncbi:MAG: glycine--tRNA ligase [Phycisphaerae bacterium]|nr:glycine--tRNA ligase [Phycisphaerae bacterium]
MAKSSERMEKIVSLCKRRGFIFQSSEIYGGINGFWDYGPLGVELKRNIKDAWWHDMVTNPPPGPDGRELQMVGLDAAIIMNPKVWEASGHVGGFNDPMVDCKECKARLRADQLWVRMAGFWAPPPLFSWSALHFNTTIASSRADAEDSLGKELSKRALKEFDGNAPNFVFLTFQDCWQQFKDQLDPGTPRPLGYPKEIATVPHTWRERTPCPECGARGTLTGPRQFNLMFESHAGAVRDEENKVYLRPETAQGIFADYKNVIDSTRIKLPFGIAQIGKAFRNEINPRNYTFRSREFEQMEIEFFCREDEAMRWWEYWRDVRIKWYVELGLAGDNLRPREQTKDELAHYSKVCTDIEYCFPFADEPQELEGVAHRGTYDLGKHQEHSGKDLTYFDDDAWQRDQARFSKEEAKQIKQNPPYRFLPTVIEPSAGADRSALAFICEAYTEDASRPSPELLKFHPRLAPIKAAVFPLVNKDGLPEIADPIYRDVKKRWPAAMDVKASIGKRYARMDEAGTPYCFTIDGQTKEDGTVTVRDRDTGHQDRIDKTRVVEYLGDQLPRRGV